VSYGEQIMSKDKYPSIFSRQMEAIVYVTLIFQEVWCHTGLTIIHGRRGENKIVSLLSLSPKKIF